MCQVSLSLPDRNTNQTKGGGGAPGGPRPEAVPRRVHSEPRGRVGEGLGGTPGGAVPEAAHGRVCG